MGNTLTRDFARRAAWPYWRWEVKVKSKFYKPHPCRFLISYRYERFQYHNGVGVSKLRTINHNNWKREYYNK